MYGETGPSFSCVNQAPANRLYSEEGKQVFLPSSLSLLQLRSPPLLTHTWFKYHKAFPSTLTSSPKSPSVQPCAFSQVLLPGGLGLELLLKLSFTPSYHGLPLMIKLLTGPLNSHSHFPRV